MTSSSIKFVESPWNKNPLDNTFVTWGNSVSYGYLEIPGTVYLIHAFDAREAMPLAPHCFAAISQQGEALRRLHLMEDADIGETPYPFDGEEFKVLCPRNFKRGPGETGWA